MPPSWREVSESRDLRAGLLPRGTTQSSTWASYDEDHLRRLRLVRALADVAGLSLEEVRGVVDAVAASESTTRLTEPPSGPSRQTSHGIPRRRPSNESTGCSPVMWVEGPRRQPAPTSSRGRPRYTRRAGVRGDRRGPGRVCPSAGARRRDRGRPSRRG